MSEENKPAEEPKTDAPTPAAADGADKPKTEAPAEPKAETPAAPAADEKPKAETPAAPAAADEKPKAETPAAPAAADEKPKTDTPAAPASKPAPAGQNRPAGGGGPGRGPGGPGRGPGGPGRGPGGPGRGPGGPGRGGPGGRGGGPGRGGPGGNRGPGGRGGPGGGRGRGGPGGRGRRDDAQADDGPDLLEKVVHINRCAKVVKGGRRFSFSALVVTGDKDGKVGFGFGKANEVAECIRKASDSAKDSMVKVSRAENTIPHEVIGEFGGGRVMLRPASPGTGIIAGGAMRAVIEASGIKDVLGKSLGSNNHANVVKATLTALQSLRTKDEIYSLRGKKVAEKKAI